MRTVIVAVIGVVGSTMLARTARRYTVSDRLRNRRGSRALPQCVARPLTAALDAAAVDCSPVQAIQIWMLATFVAGLLGAAIAGSAGVLVAMGVAISGPVGLRLARDRSRRKVAAAVPEVLERLASELRAGGTIATGIDALAQTEGPVAQDLARLTRRVKLGASLSNALHAWVAERDAYGVDAAGRALAMCVLAGGQSADALDGLASSLRERLAVIAEARALSSQARLSALVIGLAPLAYLACSTAFDARTAHVLFATPLGLLCLAVGLALECVGAWWMRRIVRSGEST